MIPKSKNSSGRGAASKTTKIANTQLCDHCGLYISKRAFKSHAKDCVADSDDNEASDEEIENVSPQSNKRNGKSVEKSNHQSKKNTTKKQKASPAIKSTRKRRKVIESDDEESDQDDDINNNSKSNNNNNGDDDDDDDYNNDNNDNDKEDEINDTDEPVESDVTDIQKNLPLDLDGDDSSDIEEPMRTKSVDNLLRGSKKGKNAPAALSTPQPVKKTFKYKAKSASCSSTPLKATENLTILKGVIAFVDVRVSNADINTVMVTQLERMGAEVSNRFTTKVTHLVFKEGFKANYDKAKARDIPVVSVLWVDKCLTEKRFVPVEDFTPSVVPKVGEAKRRRSMGPKETPTLQRKGVASTPSTEKKSTSKRANSVSEKSRKESPLKPQKRKSLSASSKSRLSSSSTKNDDESDEEMDIIDRKYIVGTNLDINTRDIFSQTVKHLENSKPQEKFTSKTTHVVCGKNRRTINILNAIANGCWVVSINWILESLSAGKWLNEEQYELADWLPGAKVARLEKKLLNKGIGDKPFQYQNKVFKERTIFIQTNTNPPTKDLQNLVTACGGEITLDANEADLIVGDSLMTSYSSKTHVLESWILDSVEAQNQLPLDHDYLVRRSNRASSPEI